MLALLLQSGRWLLVAALATGSIVRAEGENLVKVYEMPSGEATFLDQNSVQTVGTTKRYWIVTKLPAPDQYRVVVRRTYMEVDCNARMRAQRAFVDYDVEGTVVASDGALDKPGQWRPIVPGSNGDLVRSMVCGN